MIEATRKPEWRRRTRSEVAFLRRALGLRRGAKLLDVACGTGRHSIEFSKSGILATGFDYSSRYLAEARREARKARADVRWVRGDMRRLPFRPEFDAAINLFSSFGYFTRGSDDDRVLRGIGRALKPGGVFAIEIVNGDFIYEHLDTSLRKGWPVTHWGQVADGVLTLEDPRLLRKQRAVVTDWIFFTKQGRREMTSFFRLRSRESFAAAFRKAGLRLERSFGGLDGSPFDAERSRRMLLIARKGAA